ncbi:hypothetical protein BC827DRAFT_1387297 [Russula dissimulans]|nr:hypothetical protein BC827DRAFT_1387297 [Russula dissimulans]
MPLPFRFENIAAMFPFVGDDTWKWTSGELNRDWISRYKLPDNPPSIYYRLRWQIRYRTVPSTVQQPSLSPSVSVRDLPTRVDGQWMVEPYPSMTVQLYGRTRTADGAQPYVETHKRQRTGKAETEDGNSRLRECWDVTRGGARIGKLKST